MKRLELLIHPPVIAFFCAILAISFHSLFPKLSFNFWAFRLLSILFVSVGSMLGLLGIYNFRKVSTTTNPRKPEESSRLVISGVYKYTRNPMYLGLLIILMGWGLFLGNILSFAMAFLFQWYITRFQIMPEERILLRKFGSEYLEYTQKVKRWG